MIKAIYFMYRKPGWSVDEFQDYWRDTHGDLIRKIPEVRNCIQCHTLLSGYGRPTPPPADGIEEISFDAPETMTALETTLEGRSAIKDLENFTDTSRVGRIIAQDIIIKNGVTHGGMVRNIEFVSKKPDMPLTDFRHYWKEIHGPVAARIDVIEHYVQSHTLLSEYEAGPPPAYDGVASTWFENTAAMRQSAATPEYAAHHADMFNFLAGELPFIITREIKIV